MSGQRIPNSPGNSSVPSSIVLPAEHEALRRLGPWLAELLGPPRDDDVPGLLARIELALHEVCVNVVDHAYGGGPGELTVTGWMDDSTVRLLVTDRGCAFERKSVTAPRPGVPQIRGYGMMIVEQLVDSLEYRRTSDTNFCEMMVTRRVGGSAG